MPVNPPKKTRPWVVKAKKFNNPDNELYQSYRWRKFSKLYKEKHPLCIKCEAEGITAATAVTDHIIRVCDGGEVYNETNLQPLCTFHHNQKSGKERHGIKV